MIPLVVLYVHIAFSCN